VKVQALEPFSWKSSAHSRPMSTIFIDSYRGHYTPDPPGTQTEKLPAAPNPAFGSAVTALSLAAKTIKLYLCTAWAKLQECRPFSYALSDWAARLRSQAIPEFSQTFRNWEAIAQQPTWNWITIPELKSGKAAQRR
jgi:hypothetical protein